MGRSKLEKFADLDTLPNAYQNFKFLKPQLLAANRQPVDLKGKWASEHFKNDKPIVLELACGKGDYTIALAKRYPDKNFIGVDIKGNRIWTGAKTALDEGLENAAFLRSRIELLEHFFEQGEVSEIWITFPDPFLKKSNANHRLTSPRFLKVYQKICNPGTLIHLKTDSRPLFDFTLEVLKEQQIPVNEKYEDLHRIREKPEVLTILTYYERMHIADSRTINYVNFRLP